MCHEESKSMYIFIYMERECVSFYAGTIYDWFLVLETKCFATANENKYPRMIQQKINISIIIGYW